MNSLINDVLRSVNKILLGKEQHVKLALTCLLAKGHLLIEDLPGMGKTTLAHSLAKVLGLEYERVQFTSDLLPADILGVSVFDRDSGSFRFHEGPVFTHVLLADEINRTTPKTQSALLEAMEEKQVSIEGETRKLPHPFFVIATQNPLSQAGTYALPESQLDRFLMRISLGYPSHDSERLLLQGIDPRARLKDLKPAITQQQLFDLQQHVEQVKATDQLLDYLQRLVDFTRTDEAFSFGLSPRGTIALLRAAKAWALLHDREYLIPEDIQIVMPCVVEHRVKGVHAEVPARIAQQHNGLVGYMLSRIDVVER